MLNIPDFYEAVITSTDVFAVERTLSHIHERSVSSHVGVFPTGFGLVVCPRRRQSVPDTFVYRTRSYPGPACPTQRLYSGKPTRPVSRQIRSPRGRRLAGRAVVADVTFDVNMLTSSEVNEVRENFQWLIPAVDRSSR